MKQGSRVSKGSEQGTLKNSGHGSKKSRGPEESSVLGSMGPSDDVGGEGGMPQEAAVDFEQWSPTPLRSNVLRPLPLPSTGDTEPREQLGR